jgi:hypothetical protein
MKVLVIIVLPGVALFALAWWRSGRSGALTRMDGDAARQYADTVAGHEMTGIRVVPPPVGS